MDVCCGKKILANNNFVNSKLFLAAEKFDMVLVADAVEPRMKKAIGLMIRHFLPNAPILQIGRTRPDLDGNCFVTSGSREDVLRSVFRILNSDDIPPAAL